jgi:lipoate-protein ligase A
VDTQEVAAVKRFEYKVPGGKLLRAKIEVEGEKIKFLQLTGDFFMEPETDLEELEAQLLGSRAEPALIEVAVKDFFTRRKTRMAGASPADFAHVINQALRA